MFPGHASTDRPTVTIYGRKCSPNFWTIGQVIKEPDKHDFYSSLFRYKLIGPFLPKCVWKQKLCGIRCFQLANVMALKGACNGFKMSLCPEMLALVWS